MRPYWSYGDRIKPVELTRGVDFMCGCIYGLVLSHTVSHGLVRSLIRLYTDMAPYQVFKSFKNHTRLSRIHSNGTSVTRIRPRLVRLNVRFTRMANRISRVFSVIQALDTDSLRINAVCQHIYCSHKRKYFEMFENQIDNDM